MVVVVVVRRVVVVVVGVVYLTVAGTFHMFVLGFDDGGRVGLDGPFYIVRFRDFILRKERKGLKPQR